MSTLKINLAEGTYVVAVSGGVDSVVLLDLLCKNYQTSTPMQKDRGSDGSIGATNYKLIIAHFDHGIRADSEADRKYVQKLADERGLEFTYKEGSLGKDASEEAARKARYDFLFKTMKEYNAEAVVTAHHQDDIMETAIINIIRGTTARGLVSLRSRPGVIRPLLGCSKSEIIKYAEENNLSWREDPTNRDTNYLRNYIRHDILSSLSAKKKTELLEGIRSAGDQVAKLDKELSEYFDLQPEINELNRHQLIMMPHDVSREVMAEWLRKNGVKNINSSMIERLVVAAKTYLPGRMADVSRSIIMRISSRKLELTDR